MPKPPVYVQCGTETDEDGEYLTIVTTSGTVRLQNIQPGEEVTNGFTQFLKARAFGPRNDGSIAVSLLTEDRRARQEIYRVPQDNVISEDELKLTFDHC